MYIDNQGNRHWISVNGKYHRLNDLPAFEGIDGTKAWFVGGVRHREGGPAIEWVGGKREWWINGIECSEKEFRERIKNEN